VCFLSKKKARKIAETTRKNKREKKQGNRKEKVKKKNHAICIEQIHSKKTG
jgi:hypothetical protein